MKTYNFNICKYHITITIEKRKYETIDRLEMAKDLVKSQPEEIKMEEKPTTHETFWPIYIPFSEYCTAYIDGHVGIYSDATLKGSRNIVEKHLDSLMVCDIQDVTETCIQDAFDCEIDKGLSVKTLKGYKSFVLKVIDEYYDNGFMPNIRVTKETVDETA